MRDLITLVALLILTIFLLVLQELIPPFYALGGARLQLVPLLFCLGAFVLGFPSMLIFAFGAGLLFDLMNLQWVGPRPEIALGTTVLFFILLGAVCQGMRPLFQNGSYWLLSLMGGLATCLLPALQFLLLSLRRLESSGFFWSNDILWRIFLPGLLAAVLAPALLVVYHFIGGTLRPQGREPMYE
jgi:cell shape-determining protein MreD